MQLREKENLLVCGYLRLKCKELKVNDFPPELVNMCFVWYHQRYEILRWSSKYKTNQLLELSDDNRCVTRRDGIIGGSSGCYNYQWILCDVEPVFSGTHCWRLHQLNPQGTWINYGVGAKRMYEDDKFAPPTVWAIANNSCWYGGGPYGGNHLPVGPHRNDAYVYGYKGRRKTLEIDIYLDADEGNMKFVVVGEIGKTFDGKTTEAKLFKMPTNTKHGWVPYINTATNGGMQLRIAKIPPEWYGTHYDGIFDDE